MGRYANEVLENAIDVMESTQKIYEEGGENPSVFERIKLDLLKELKKYRSICDNPEKLKLIDSLYLERCEEINRLKMENAELHCEMQAMNALLFERDKETKSNAIDEFVKIAMKQFTEFDIKHGYPTVADCKDILRDIGERMKEVQA